MEITGFSDFAPQGAVYGSLTQTLKNDSLVHACLITGMQGVGKKTLAERLTRFLLCTGENKPCGHCEACVQAESGNHPDIITVQAGVPIAPGVKKDMTIIPVNEIR